MHARRVWALRMQLQYCERLLNGSASRAAVGTFDLKIQTPKFYLYSMEGWVLRPVFMRCLSLIEAKLLQSAIAVHSQFQPATEVVLLLPVYTATSAACVGECLVQLQALPCIYTCRLAGLQKRALMVALAGLRGCLRTICVGVADPNSALLLSLSLCRSSVSAETATPEKSSPAKPCTNMCTLRPGSAVVSVGKSRNCNNSFDSGAKPFEIRR